MNNKKNPSLNILDYIYLFLISGILIHTYYWLLNPSFFLHIILTWVLNEKKDYKRYKKIWTKSFSTPFSEDDAEYFHLKLVNKKEGGFIIVIYLSKRGLDYTDFPHPFDGLYWMDEREILIKNNRELLPEEVFY